MNRYFSGFAIAEFNVNAGREILDINRDTVKIKEPACCVIAANANFFQPAGGQYFHSALCRMRQAIAIYQNIRNCRGAGAMGAYNPIVHTYNIGVRSRP